MRGLPKQEACWKCGKRTVSPFPTGITHEPVTAAVKLMEGANECGS